MQDGKPNLIAEVNMTLYEAAKEYLVYMQAHRLPAGAKQAARESLRHVLWFYGRSKPLSSMDNSTVLQYIKVFDPFDCDPLNETRGAEFCNFVEWLMHNHLIPAWSEQMKAMQDWAEGEEDIYHPHSSYYPS